MSIRKRKKDADDIQLWSRITKTEYPDPPDTGDLPVCSQLPDRDLWAGIPEAKRRFNAAEHLVHTTKKKQARFDFDIRFPKMPSYLRRAAIQHALGSVSSYESRLEQWKRTGKKAGKPTLVYENHAMPVFYRDVMYREGMEGKEEADLKLYDGHDWKWFCVRLKHTDLEYLRKNWFGKKGICPDTGKKTPQIFPSVFLYRRSNTCRNTCERTGHLQCGSGDQYGCFIRELFKPLPATERSLLEAKVPSVKRRTSCVYADLRELSSKMSSFKVS